jgi:pyrroloquinoline quinone (PQQ) biosynthesis protein C/mannose-6-phosphate isomerase-like protein (cupin superfamily)
MNPTHVAQTKTSEPESSVVSSLSIERAPTVSPPDPLRLGESVPVPGVGPAASGAAAEASSERALERLREAQRTHSFWQNRLLRACVAGELSKSDFQFVFSQYYLYSKNFTRYLAALMASCDSDYHRARLSENLWEEGGMAAPEDRHAEIFRRFLREGLQINLDEVEYLDSTRYFVREYLDFCMRSNAAASAAFLSLGTEAIVSRLYGMMVAGLQQAGVPQEHLQFFHIHMECDDEHAETLEQMMVSYSSVPGWYETCLHALNYALHLRERFFEKLYDHLQVRRLSPLLARIQDRRSLAAERPDMQAFRTRPGAINNIALYDNVNQRLNIDFAVERAPFAAEVLDSRILRIAPHRNNELHKHPHESLFYVISGKGTIRINESLADIEAGEMAFVPRWALHQTTNRGDDELVILAVTDFGMTRQTFLGNHVRSTRMKGAQAGLPGEAHPVESEGTA